MSMTQNRAILSLLRDRGTLGVTPLLALERVGTLRLGARIFALRDEGYDIITHHQKIGRNKTVARYELRETVQLRWDNGA